MTRPYSFLGFLKYSLPVVILAILLLSYFYKAHLPSGIYRLYEYRTLYFIFYLSFYLPSIGILFEGFVNS